MNYYVNLFGETSKNYFLLDMSCDWLMCYYD